MQPNHGVTLETSLVDAYLGEERLFERLVAYAPVFHRFAHVLLDEDLARELRLSDVAAMAGVPARDLTVIASGAPIPKPPSIAPDPPSAPSPPAWLEEVPVDNVRFVDVRPLLEKGHGPLRFILEAVEGMSTGDVLAVDATFHPVPLRRLLEHRGLVSHGEQKAPDHWRVYIRLLAR